MERADSFSPMLSVFAFVSCVRIIRPKKPSEWTAIVEDVASNEHIVFYRSHSENCACCAGDSGNSMEEGGG